MLGVCVRGCVHVCAGAGICLHVCMRVCACVHLCVHVCVHAGSTLSLHMHYHTGRLQVLFRRAQPREFGPGKPGQGLLHEVPCGDAYVHRVSQSLQSLSLSLPIPFCLTHCEYRAESAGRENNNAYNITYIYICMNAYIHVHTCI